jgi:DUF1680 family protein
METMYPWDGKVTIRVNPQKKLRFNLHVRIPGWARNEPVPGDLYKFTSSVDDHQLSISINGKPFLYQIEKGYAVIGREWKKNDVLEINFPMDIKRIVAKPELKFNNDRVALQRGPLVYCVEGADNNGKAWNLVVPDNATFSTRQLNILSEPVIGISTELPVVNVSDDGMSLKTEITSVTAIPYYSWCNRGQNPMQVWLPRKIKDVKLNY